jgi:hypothetical protein
MFGTIVSPHMVNIVHRVFFFPFLIQNEKALALVAPRCVVLAIHHPHLQSQIPIDMKKKKKRRKNDGVDVLVAVTAYVFARHL